MALKQYDVEINGMKTTLQLSDEDAKLYGLVPAEPAAKARKAPANKAAKPPANKSGDAG